MPEHPRWCHRPECTFFPGRGRRPDEVCHRSEFRVLDSTYYDGHAEAWVESWDRAGERGRVHGPPLVVLETRGKGSGIILRPAEALDLGVLLIGQAVRAAGAPSRWRTLRMVRLGEQTDRIRARITRRPDVPEVPLQTIAEPLR